MQVSICDMKIALVNVCEHRFVLTVVALMDCLSVDVQLAAVQEASLVRNRDEDGIPLLLLKLCQN